MRPFVRDEFSVPLSLNDVYTYSYDKRGNRVSETGPKASQEFVFDATNRMVSGTNWKGDESAYTYNGLGIRVNNTHTTHAGQVYERDYVIDYTSFENDDLYVYAMGNGQLEYEQLHVYAGSERIEQFTERGNGNWERTLYVHEDVMGNTRYYTKTNGQSFAELEYDAWGMPASPNKLLNNDHGNYVFATFTGHIYDTTLDMYFAEARFYDANNRQWLSMDPVKDGLNWYLYCGANPTTYWDPTGLVASKFNQLRGSGSGSFMDSFENWWTNASNAYVNQQLVSLELNRHASQVLLQNVGNWANSFLNAQGRAAELRAQQERTEWLAMQRMGKWFVETTFRDAKQRIEIQQMRAQAQHELMESVKGGIIDFYNAYNRTVEMNQALQARQQEAEYEAIKTIMERLPFHKEWSAGDDWNENNPAVQIYPLHYNIAMLNPYYGMEYSPSNKKATLDKNVTVNVGIKLIELEAGVFGIQYDIGNPGGTYVRMELASVETALSAGIDTKTFVRGNISAMASFYTVIVGYEFPDGSRVEGSLYLGAVGNINRIESNHFQFAVAPAGWGGGIELILAPDE